MTEDQQLLRKYVHDGAPDALDELVRRYRDLVYSSALRQVRDAHLAEDVAQAVFIVLSKKASTIRQGVATGGWLLAVTRRAALNAMKKQAIQHRHERAAAKKEGFEEGQANWEQIDPVLDEVMSRLPSTDRDAVVLRFFQQRSFAQVGAELGLSEEAARKRVERAIERMRGLLRGRGVAVGAAALGASIAANSVHAAPATIAVSCASASATSFSKGVITMMTLSKLKAVVAAAAMFVIVTGGAALVVTATAQQPSDVAQTPPAAPPATAPIQQAASAREAILLRFMSLQNLTITYHVDTTYPRAVAGPASMSAEYIYSRLGERVRIDSSDTKVSAALATSNTAVKSMSMFNGEITQSLYEQLQKGQTILTGYIGAEDHVSNDLVEWAMGMSHGGVGIPRVTIADLELMDIAAAPGGRVILSSASARLQPNAPPGTVQWELRPDLGYAICAYRYLAGADKHLNIEVIAEDFRPVNGVMLPFTVKQRIGSMRNGQWSDTQRTIATIKEYKFNDPANTKARYQLTWPPGARVSDAIENKEYVVDGNGKLVDAPSPAK